MNRTSGASPTPRVAERVQQDETAADILATGQQRALLGKIIGNKSLPYFENDKRLRSFLEILSEAGIHLNKKLRRADRQTIVTLFNERCLKQPKKAKPELKRRTVTIPDDAKPHRSRQRRRHKPRRGQPRASVHALDEGDIKQICITFEDDRLFQMLSGESQKDFFNFASKKIHDFSDKTTIQELFRQFVEAHTDQTILVGDVRFIKRPRRRLTFREPNTTSPPPLTQAILLADPALAKIILDAGEDPKRIAPFPDALDDAGALALEAGATKFLEDRQHASRPAKGEILPNKTVLDHRAKFIQKTLMPAFPSLISKSIETIRIAGCNALTAAIILCAGKRGDDRSAYQDILQHILDWSSTHAKIDLINARDDRGETPLTTAVACCDADIVHRILDCRADVALPNKNGRTPILIAISEGSIELIELLLKYNGDPFDKTPDNLCALALAHLREGNFSRSGRRTAFVVNPGRRRTSLQSNTPDDGTKRFKRHTQFHRHAPLSNHPRQSCAQEYSVQNGQYRYCLDRAFFVFEWIDDGGNRTYATGRSFAVYGRI